MDQGADTAHNLTSPNITTINYTLEWPHLENPSNTTFAGLAQLDICRCPHVKSYPIREKQEDSWPEDRPKEKPGHFYTRYQCSGPQVRFKSATDGLWVLKSPHGPINMLQPAGNEDLERRREIHEGAEPTAYAGKNIILLTGPCPRGRYQAYATIHYLKSLKPEARKNLEYISLLIQPYEEDWTDKSAKKSYDELAEYILHNLPSFKALHLNVWDDEERLRDAASAFSIVLHKNDIEIVVGWSWCGGEVQHYSSARTFLEAMKAKKSKGRRSGKDSFKEGTKGSESVDNSDWEDIEENDEEVVTARDSGCFKEVPISAYISAYQPRTTSTYDSSGSLQRRIAFRGAAKNTITENSKVNSSVKGEQEVRMSNSKEQDWDHISEIVEENQRSPEGENEDQSDDEWVDVETSPTSPNSEEERTWQVL